MPLNSGLRLYRTDPSLYAGATALEISQDGTQTNPDTDVYNSDLSGGQTLDKQLWIGVERCRLGANITSTGQTAITLGAVRFNVGDAIIFDNGINSEVMNIAVHPGTVNIIVTRSGSPIGSFLANATSVYLYRKYTNVTITAEDTNFDFPPQVPGLWGQGDEINPGGPLNPGLTVPVYRVAPDSGGIVVSSLAKSISFAGPLVWAGLGSVTNATFWRRGFIPEGYAGNYTGDKFDIQFLVTATEAPV